VLKAGKNLGWMGGINHGIKNSVEPYVMFLNDDIKVLDFDYSWLQKMLLTFKHHPEVGVVAPSSNAVMGFQNFLNEPEAVNNIVSCVSGFCLLTKREVIDKVGLLDESLPGGDDVDFSIRVRKAGWKISSRKDVFLYHFCSLTGRSVHGGYWDSREHSDLINQAMIRKHGLTEHLVASSFIDPDSQNVQPKPFVDWEADVMLPFCEGKGLDIGCGNRKIPGSIGVDLTPGGKEGDAGSQMGMKCAADVTVADTDLPFDDDSMDYVHARHVLEHIVDPLAALREWARVLKPGGKMVVAAPDEELVDGMPLDPTHKHAFTRGSFKNLLGAVTAHKVLAEKQNDKSFVCVVEV